MASATLGMFLLLAWHVLNTLRVSHQLTTGYSHGLATANQILSAHQRLALDAHLIVFDGKPERADAYRQNETALARAFAEARRDKGGDPLFDQLLNSIESTSREFRHQEYEALAASARGDASEARELLHRPMSKIVAWPLEAEVARYIEALDWDFSRRLDTEGDKERVSLFAAFVIFALSVALWTLLIQRLRVWGLALEEEMAQRRAAEEQLRQSQKIEALGMMAAGVSHDFNNVLSVIQGFVDVARSRLVDGSCIDDALQKIQAATRQGTDLTRSLLTFSGRAGTHMEPLDIDGLVANTVRLLKETVPAAIEVRVDSTITPADGWVWGNQAQLQQALVNLVLNARDAIPIEGGSLVVTLDRIPGSSESEAAGAIRLKVTDTGTGIPEDARERIFEPFFTTKPRGQGTGLGLSVVAAVIKEHGGRISVDSTPGQGTSVVLDLPALDPTGLPNKAATRATGRVLTALADPYAADLLASALSDAGYQVRTVSSALELADAIRTDQPTLVIVDCDLSGFDEEALIEALDVQFRKPHVVMIGEQSSDLIEKRLGPEILFVKKPFLISELTRLASAVSTSHGPEESANTGSR